MCARRERRKKRAEWVAMGRNFMISLGISCGPRAFSGAERVNSIIECVAGDHVGEGGGGVC
jgi:hypothetical protein